MDDGTAIRACQAGAMEAFAVLVGRHTEHVYLTAYRITKDAARAEDVTQETFLLLAQRLPQLLPGPLRGWLTRVATNLALNEVRRKTPVPWEMLPAAEREMQEGRALGETLEEQFVAGEEQHSLYAAMTTLTLRQRAMLILAYHGGLSHREIAHVLGCQPGTVSATLHQAIARLRTAMPPSSEHSE